MNQAMPHVGGCDLLAWSYYAYFATEPNSEWVTH